MPRKIEGEGVIQVICSSCGFTYHEYVIGSSGNKNKYIGPPTPAKALSGFDGRMCPICGKPASVVKPRRVVFMTEREYVENVKLVEVKARNGDVLMKFVIIDDIDEVHALQVKKAVEESASAMYPGAAPQGMVASASEAVDGASSI